MSAQQANNTAMNTEKTFTEDVVNIDRVARVVKGGRRFRFRALVVVGDGKGKVGIGIAKGADVQTAITKAVEDGKKNLVNIPLQNGTIPHDTEAKVGGAHIFLKPAAKGTGIIAGGVVRTILEAAGAHNILSKSLGSSNKVNGAYATVKALQELKPRSEWLTTKVREENEAKSKKSTKKGDK